MRMLEMQHGIRRYPIQLQAVEGEVLECLVQFYPMFLQIGEKVQLVVQDEQVEATILFRTLTKVYFFVPFAINSASTESTSIFGEQRLFSRFSTNLLTHINTSIIGSLRDLSLNGAGLWMKLKKEHLPHHLWLETTLLGKSFEAGYTVKQHREMNGGLFLGLKLSQVNESNFQLLSDKVLYLQKQSIEHEHLHQWMERVAVQD